MDSTNAPQIIEHMHKGVNYTPYDTRWIPSSSRFVAMGQYPKATGCLQVYSLNHGEPKLIHECEKKHGIKCGTFGASALEDRHLATGDYAGMLNIWDLERPDVPVFSVNAHTSIINSIDGIGGLSVGNGAPEIVTGSRDGCVRVWDPRQKTPVVSLEPEKGEAPRDCWTCCFGNSHSDDERVICAGYDNGDVKMFDLRTYSLRWETNVQNGVVGIEFDRRDIEMNKCIVTTLESKFRVYDLRTQHPDEGFAFMSEKAHKSTIWLGRHCPQNRDIFMTGGGNGGLNIYKYKYPTTRVKKDKDDIPQGVPGTVELLNSRIIAPQPIVSFDWSPDRQGLAVLACLDQTVRVYIVTKLDKY